MRPWSSNMPGNCNRCKSSWAQIIDKQAILPPVNMQILSYDANPILLMFIYLSIVEHVLVYTKSYNIGAYQINIRIWCSNLHLRGMPREDILFNLQYPLNMSVREPRSKQYFCNNTITILRPFVSEYIVLMHITLVTISCSFPAAWLLVHSWSNLINQMYYSKQVLEIRHNADSGERWYGRTPDGQKLALREAIRNSSTKSLLAKKDITSLRPSSINTLKCWIWSRW